MRTIFSCVMPQHTGGAMRTPTRKCESEFSFRLILARELLRVGCVSGRSSAGNIIFDILLNFEPERCIYFAGRKNRIKDFLSSVITVRIFNISSVVKFIFLWSVVLFKVTLDKLGGYVQVGVSSYGTSRDICYSAYKLF